MKKKILTLDNLIDFCMKNQFHHFSSNESGYQLCVAVPSTFEVQKFDEGDNSKEGLMKVKIRILHTLKNRNNSYISKEAALNAAESIKGRPILAYIHQLDDGSWDFGGHEIEYDRDENGNIYIEYIEKQVGSFTESDPFFEYDADADKEYLCSYGIIPTEYTKAAEIIRSKGGTKTSSELYVDEMTYDANEKVLYLNKFYVSGLTLLGAEDDGTQIGEGMEGSRADIVDFSVNNNSTINSQDNIQRKEEVQMSKFEELLQQYNVTAEDITFEYTDLTDEELEAKFAELFDNTQEEEQDEVENTTDVEENLSNEENSENFEDNNKAANEENVDEVEEVTEEAPVEEKFVALTYSSNIDGNMQTFEKSMQNTLALLYRIVQQTYGNDNTYYDIDAYPESGTVIMHDYKGDSYYRQAYEVNDDGCSLVGERVQVYPRFLSKEEIEKFDELEHNFEDVTSQLEVYQDAENKAKMFEVLNSSDYETLHEENDFINFANEVKNNYKNFTVEDVQNKCDTLLLSYVKAKKALKFSADNGEGVAPTKVTFFPEKNTKPNRYGNLFS